MLDLGLNRKTAIITGCNNPLGIGAATARAFAAQGVNVFLHYFRVPYAGETPEDYGEAYVKVLQNYTAQPLVDQINAAQSGRAAALEGNLEDPGLVPRLFEAAEAAFGPVEILVNNAAHSVPDTLLPGKSPKAGDRGAGGLGFGQSTITAESVDRHFSVNTRATALMMAEFCDQHAARQADWGRIINISTDGSAGFAGEVSYGASKHAMEAYSRAAAKEFGRWGITVNIASAGPIQTGWMTSELERAVARNTPLGRPGRPEDVADAILLLASEQARWITGQTVHIGGGHRMI